MNFDDAFYLSIQSTYLDAQIAIYHNDMQLGIDVIKKTNASADLVPSLNELLNRCNLTLHDLSFVAVNQGPAPFTTLRVVIASMNGLSFATLLPLIGIDGIQALLAESSDNSDLTHVALLDAFANDVYFAYKDLDDQIVTGCMPVSSLLLKIADTFGGKNIKFVGNGAVLYSNEIKAHFNNSIISEKFATCSLTSVAELGLKRWRLQEGLSKQLLPLYLKKQWWQKENLL